VATTPAPEPLLLGLTRAVDLARDAHQAVAHCRRLRGGFWSRSLQRSVRGRGPLVRLPRWSPFFPRPCGSAVCSNHGSIKSPLLIVDQAMFVELELERTHHPIPSFIATPGRVAVIDGLPVAVAFRNIGPGSSSMQTPEDPVDKRTVLAEGMTNFLRIAREMGSISAYCSSVKS
jgi:hypothetical protein